MDELNLTNRARNIAKELAKGIYPRTDIIGSLQEPQSILTLIEAIGARLKSDRTKYLELLMSAPQTNHPADERGPCLCRGCTWTREVMLVRARPEIAADLPGVMSLAERLELAQEEIARLKQEQLHITPTANQ